MRPQMEISESVFFMTSAGILWMTAEDLIVSGYAPPLSMVLVLSFLQSSFQYHVFRVVYLIACIFLQTIYRLLCMLVEHQRVKTRVSSSCQTSVAARSLHVSPAARPRLLSGHSRYVCPDFLHP